jgi:hypothetical protein
LIVLWVVNGDEFHLILSADTIVLNGVEVIDEKLLGLALAGIFILFLLFSWGSLCASLVNAKGWEFSTGYLFALRDKATRARVE